MKSPLGRVLESLQGHFYRVGSPLASCAFREGLFNICIFTGNIRNKTGRTSCRHHPNRATAGLSSWFFLAKIFFASIYVKYWHDLWYVELISVLFQVVSFSFIILNCNIGLALLRNVVFLVKWIVFFWEIAHVGNSKFAVINSYVILHISVRPGIRSRWKNGGDLNDSFKPMEDV